MGDSRFVQIVQEVCVQLGLLTKQLTGHTPHLVRHPADEGFTLCGVGDIPDLRVYYREQDRYRHDSPPTVCFVARGGPIVDADKAGPQKDENGVVVRQLRRRMFGFEVFVWGQDLEQTEDLIDNLILAIESCRNAGPTDTSFGDEEWTSQQEGQGGQETLGYAVSFTATIQQQVLSKPRRLVRVTGINIDVTLLDQTEHIEIR